MSLEVAIAELTEQLKINNELMKKSLASRGEALEKISKISKDTAKPESTAKALKEDKPAKKSKLTEKDVRHAFGEFMDIEDEDELDRRKAAVRKLLDKYDSKRATDVPADQWEDLLAGLAAIKAKFDAESSEDDDEEEDERPAKKAKKPARDEDEDDEEDERPRKKSRQDDEDEEDDE